MRIVAIVFLALCSACVSFTYERHSTFEPVLDSSVAALAVGHGDPNGQGDITDIGHALAQLGAPLYVWEGADGAVVLAYGYENQREWGFRVSVPVADQASASFNYDDIAAKLKGYILVFDRDLKLTIVRAGLLRDLAKLARLRPAPVE